MTYRQASLLVPEDWIPRIEELQTAGNVNRAEAVRALLGYALAQWANGDGYRELTHRLADERAERVRRHQVS